MKNNFLLFAIAAAILCLNVEVQAVTNFRIAGLELHPAYVLVEDPVEDAIAYGGSINLGNINTNAYLRVDVQYWQKTFSHPRYPDNYVEEWDYSDLATKINIKYVIPFARITPYVGTGFTIHVYKKERTSSYGHLHKYEMTELGFQGFLGIEDHITNNLYWLIEVAFDRSDRDQILIGGGLGFRIK